MPRVTFLPEGMTIEIGESTSLLEAARKAGIPLTHACGGRARCSTCRVAVSNGLRQVCARTELEERLAERLHFTPCIRLACQTKVIGDIEARRLVLDSEDTTQADQRLQSDDPTFAGEEMALAILFADIRDFTPFSESLMAYDLIHTLNRYFRQVGSAIERHGGLIDNYIGDGILALFGCDQASDATGRAVRAGLDMLRGVEDLKPYLQQAYGKTFEIGIGIHYGEAVIGTIGWGASQRRTVIGDAVNFASRVESANKIAGTKFLISHDAYSQVMGQVVAIPALTTTLKGKTGEHTLYEVTGLRE